MRNLCLGTVALAAVMASPAHADFINFAQFGPVGTAVANGAVGTTLSGVHFGITDSGAAFTEYCESKARTCAATDTWAGEFYANEVILFDNFGAGPVKISFTSPLTSLTDLQAQANDYGAFSETLDAFNSIGTMVNSDTAAWFNSTSNLTYGEGTIPVLGVAAASIAYVTVITTNNGGGFALGGVGGVGNPGGPTIPEPSTWAMMVIGLAGLGFARYRGLWRTVAPGT